jgi:hypothetical protein
VPALPFLLFGKPEEEGVIRLFAAQRHVPHAKLGLRKLHELATSMAAPGDYDMITFTGIDLRSGGPQQFDPHLASVHIYPNSP